MELDLRTLFFTLTAVEAVLAAVLLLFWKTQATVPGLAHITAGAVVTVVGSLTVALRGPIPVVVSILLSNLAFIAALLLALRGFQRARGQPVRPFFEAVMVGAVLAGLSYFTFIDFDTKTRIILLAFTFAAAGLVGAFDLLRERRPDFSVPCRFVAVLFVFFSASELFTGIATISVGADQDYLRTQTLATSLTALVTICVVIGWTLGFLWIAYDILQVRLRKTEKLDAVGRLAGGIAHELNNILTPIGSMTSVVLGEMADDDPRRIRLQLVLTASNRAAELVRRILTFGRRQDAMLPERIDVAATVREALDTLRPGFPPDLSVEEAIDDRTGQVVADAEYVRMVLENLIANARDAMEQAAGRLRISLGPVELSPRQVPDAGDLAPGRYAKLTVTDTGRGMDGATLAQAIDPFFTTKDVCHGVGLGLSVVNGITAMSGGAMQIASTPGQGTTVDVYLPLARE